MLLGRRLRWWEMVCGLEDVMGRERYADDMVGCTAVQILPELAKVAEHVTVFQRTPNWVVPRADAPVSATWRNIYKYVPGVMARKRAALMDFREWTHGFVAE